MTLVDAEYQSGSAMVESHRSLRIGIDARTQIVAIATFHVFATELPVGSRHRSLPSRQMLQPQSTVKEDRLARHVVRRIRREIQCQQSDLPQLAGTAQRYGLLGALGGAADALLTPRHDRRENAGRRT